jgi:hypothetical protein
MCSFALERFVMLRLRYLGLIGIRLGESLNAYTDVIAPLVGDFGIQLFSFAHISIVRDNE